MEPDKLQKEIDDAIWIVQNPQFEEKPANITEFLGPGYLDIIQGIRPGVLQALIDIFGEEVQTNKIADYERAMVTGAIGIGKSTLASIALPYMVHWVLCLRNPQEFFGLLPGSRIAFMMMSTSEQQAREVIFGDVFARIRYSAWFRDNYPHDKLVKKQIKFPQKDIWILPGDSKETTFEGYNILGGILDEADSHMVTKEKDYAEVGFSTIEGRVTSRFGHKGLVIVIGQMKKATGFAARKYAEFSADPNAYTMRMTIWESRGWDYEEDGKKVFLNEDGSRNSFYYDYKRRTFIPKAVGDLLPQSNTIIEIPEYYRHNFQRGPEKALKDLAGIPPKVSDPFISLVDKIESCRERWIERYFPGEESDDLSVFSPVDTSSVNPTFAPWFSNVQNADPRRRALHVDIAYSANGDSLGMAMGHIAGLKEDIDGEEKPIIVFDFLLRFHAAAGQEILLSDVRKIIYHLRDNLKFRVTKVTYDGFESTDSVQQLRKKKFIAEKASVDKSTLPYEDLRDAIYEERLEFPPYITELNRGDDDLVEIALKELSELQDTGKKIDHPVKGSKDVADSMAGVVHELIGDRKYRRGVASLNVVRSQSATGTDDARAAEILSYTQTPNLPPLIPSVDRLSDLGIVIPMHLRPRR